MAAWEKDSDSTLVWTFACLRRATGHLDEEFSNERSASNEQFPPEIISDS